MRRCLQCRASETTQNRSHSQGCGLRRLLPGVRRDADLYVCPAITLCAVRAHPRSSRSVRGEVSRTADTLGAQPSGKQSVTFRPGEWVAMVWTLPPDQSYDQWAMV